MYECDKCGACCKHLLLEIEMIDIAREPRIAAVAMPFKPPGPEDWEPELDEEEQEEYERVGPLVPGWEYGASLNTGPDHACPFLGGVPSEKERPCGIYPTRPNCCVAMQAGGDQCQSARGMAGLRPLEPI
jgi:Fe-S-cluster containining protein